MKAKHLCAFAVIVLLLLTACPDDPTEEDAFAVSTITITGIPKTIPAFRGSPAADTYKVYLYASDYITNQDPAKAKGVIRIDDTENVTFDETSQTYTVTIPLGNTSPLFKPDPNYDPNPNLNFGSWSGTSQLFTFVLSPQDTLDHGQLSIWMQGGYDLDIDKKNLDWNGSGLLNFRLRLSVQDFAQREWEFYHDNVCWDPDIITHATYLDPPNCCDLDTSKHWEDD